MYKRPVLIIAVSMLSAVFTVLYNDFFLIAVPFCLLPFAFYRRKKIHAVILSVMIVISFAAGILSASMRLSSYTDASRQLLSSNIPTIYGRVTSKDVTENGIRHTITLHGQGTKVTALIDKSIPLGTGVKVKGDMEAPESLRNPGCFDEKSYYRALSIICQVKNADIEPVAGGDHFMIRLYYHIMEILWCIKYLMQAVFTASLPGEEGPLLASLCIGTKSLLDPDVKEMFQNAGISHILAISGLHISIVGSVVFKLFKRIGIRVRVAAVISSVFVFFYAVSISDSVSARRALIMYLIVMVSDIIGDGTDTITSLAFVCIFICLTDPLAVGQTAFALSFAAVFLLAMTAIPATECYHAFCVLRWENRHKEIKGNRYKPTAINDLVSSVIFSFFIQLSMAAISAKFFYNFPLLSCLLNVVILPFLPYVLCMGLIGGLAGMVCPAAAKVILFPSHLILYWYELSSGSYTRLPFTDMITGDISFAKTIACLIMVYFVSRIFKHERQKMFIRRFTRIPWQKNNVFPPFGSRRSSAAVFALSLSVIILLAFPSHHDETVMLDVGQGDGLMITTADGKTFMIDGGSTTKSSIGKNVILPSLKYRGMHAVEGWFITHLDEDHVSGLKELVEKNYSIGNVWLSKHIEKDEKLEQFLLLCQAHDITVSYLEGGDTLSCKYFTMETVFPDKHSDFTGENENSLVTLITIQPDPGRQIKLIETGDIGEEQERYILSHYKRKLKKSSPEETLILKSAHHGSNYSNCDEWLSELDPDLILISAGKGNRYGHPGRDTMTRIHSLGLKSLCTIDTGQIRIRNGKISVLIQK
ncbi:MAG: DNA internalization-related competence protein ComEC/Rec2 [Lachnospiraceae bacterium]|nr:DNA internalization-related competence protein ComEC/Rec2 [Lachnospiraceae bacterium]